MIELNPKGMKICKTCKRKYQPSSGHLDCPKCRGRKQKTPCIDCGKLSHGAYKRCINCHNRSGEDSPGWKGGITYHKKGYLMRLVPGRKYVFEHILVMEESLGRRLLKGENVHHRNGIKDDNRLENLELWTRPQPAGIRVTDAVKWAQDVLELYAPELLNGRKTIFSEDGISTRGQYPPVPPERT